MRLKSKIFTPQCEGFLPYLCFVTAGLVPRLPKAEEVRSQGWTKKRSKTEKKITDDYSQPFVSISPSLAKDTMDKQTD